MVEEQQELRCPGDAPRRTGRRSRVPQPELEPWDALHSSDWTMTHFGLQM